MEKEAVLVHASTNPHNVVNAEEVIPEVSFTAMEGCKLITNPTHHHDVEITPGKKVVKFVRTVDLAGEYRRIRD